MRVVELIVKSAVDSAVLGTFRWRTGSDVELVDGVSELREAFERWRERGLIEIVNDADGRPDQRVTTVRQPEFLLYLAVDLQSQFGFRAELDLDKETRFELVPSEPSHASSSVQLDENYAEIVDRDSSDDMTYEQWAA